MVTLEQKLSLFKKLVDEKVQKEIDEQILNKDDEIKEFLEKEKQVLESNANRTKKAAIERIKKTKIRSDFYYDSARKKAISKEKRGNIKGFACKD